MTLKKPDVVSDMPDQRPLPLIPFIDKKLLIGMYKQGAYQEMIDQAQVLQKKYTLTASVLNIVGAAYEAIGELDAALDAFKASVSIEPDYADGYYNLGVIQNSQGDYQLTELLAWARIFSIAYLLLATCIFNIGERFNWFSA